MALNSFRRKPYEPCVWLTTAFSRSVLWAARKIRFSPLRSLKLRRSSLRGLPAAAPLKPDRIWRLRRGIILSAAFQPRPH